MESIESMKAMESMEARKSTPKVCTLSNRGYERSEHPRYDRQYHVTTPTGSTDVSSSGTPSECCSLISGRSPGVLASLVPPVTESGRLQRPPPSSCNIYHLAKRLIYHLAKRLIYHLAKRSAAPHLSFSEAQRSDSFII